MGGGVVVGVGGSGGGDGDDGVWGGVERRGVSVSS